MHIPCSYMLFLCTDIVIDKGFQALELIIYYVCSHGVATRN